MHGRFQYVPTEPRPFFMVRDGDRTDAPTGMNHEPTTHSPAWQMRHVPGRPKPVLTRAKAGNAGRGRSVPGSLPGLIKITSGRNWETARGMRVQAQIRGPCESNRQPGQRRLRYTFLRCPHDGVRESRAMGSPWVQVCASVPLETGGVSENAFQNERGLSPADDWPRQMM